jgi:hypothetical protein
MRLSDIQGAPCNSVKLHTMDSVTKKKKKFQ